jgi:hypothetical protein
MTPTQQIRLEITQAINLGLSDLGFEERKFQSQKQIDKDRMGWCGLNIATKGLNGIGINPVVGLSFEPVENFIQKTLSASDIGTTFNSSLGYLMPEARYLEWIFPLDRSIDMEAEAKKIVRAVGQYGVPFMNQFSSLEIIIENLEIFRFTDRASATNRLPFLYQMAGQPEKALAMLQEKSIALATRNDLAAGDEKKLVAALTGESFTA